MVLKRFIQIIAVALFTAVPTYTLRYLLIEPRHLHDQCLAQMSSLLCVTRQTLIMGFVLNIYAIVSLVLGVCALMLRSPRYAWAAIVVGVFAALLYRVELAGIGLLLGVLAATRPIAPQHGQSHP